MLRMIYLQLIGFEIIKDDTRSSYYLEDIVTSSISKGLKSTIPA